MPPVPGMEGGPPGMEGPGPTLTSQDIPEPGLFTRVDIPYYPPVYPDPNLEPKMPKPDVDTVLRRIEARKDHWRFRDERMDEDLDYYRGNIGTQTLAGNLLIRNIPAVMVEKAARVLGTQEPRYDVIPPKNIVKSEAQRIEDFIRHAWNVWNKRWYLSGNQTIYHDMAHYLALRGWVAARIQYNPDARTEDLPIRLRLVDPRQVYPHFSEDDGLLYVCHVYRQTVAQIRDLYPDAKGEWLDREEDEYLECKAYYDDWWYGFFIEEEEVIPIQAHEYGFVPWTILIGGGSPIRHTENDTQDWVAEVGPSVFHHIKHAYLAVNRLMSQLADEIERASNPPLLYFIDPQNRKQPIEINFDPGATNHLFFDRERVEPLSIGPSTAGSAQPLINMLMEDIEKGGLPSTLWGFGDEASGFQATINQTAARDALFPIVRAMEYAQEDINRKCLTLIRDWHDEDVGFFIRDDVGELVSGETVNFQLIDMVGTESSVRYRDISPQDRMARANIAISLVREKLISMETARSEYLELDNPERENDRVISDLVYMDEDVIKNVIIEEVLQRSDPWLYDSWMRHKYATERKQAEAEQEQPSGPQQVPPGMEGMIGPGGAPGMENGLPPDAIPPNMQGLDALLQSAGGAQGGAGLRRPQGVPGAGALPVRMPLT